MDPTSAQGSKQLVMDAIPARYTSPPLLRYRAYSSDLNDVVLQRFRCRVGGHLATEESQVRLPNGCGFVVQQPAEGEVHRTVGAREGGERTLPVILIALPLLLSSLSPLELNVLIVGYFRGRRAQSSWIRRTPSLSSFADRLTLQRHSFPSRTFYTRCRLRLLGHCPQAAFQQEAHGPGSSVEAHIPGLLS